MLRLSVGNSVESLLRYYFLKLVDNGAPLKLFIFYDETTSDDGMNTDFVERYFVQKDNRELILIGGLNFRKTMLEIVGDCPDVAQKIESKEWRKRDLVQIIRFYNNECEVTR